MSRLNIFKKGWIDMVFEGRNKSYGAYQLRSENPKTTTRALVIGILLFGSAVSAPLVTRYLSDKLGAKKEEKLDKVIETALLPPPPPKDELLPPPPPPEPPKSINDQVKFPPPKVVDKKLVRDEDPPTVKDLETADPGQKNIKGDKEAGDINIDKPSGEGPKGSDIVEENPNKVYMAVEVAPEFPGGMAGFNKYVQKNFRSPEVDEGVKVLRVIVGFVVEKDGSLTDIKVLRDPGYGMGKEAIRMLQNAPKWKPGVQNGRAVRVAYNLPITIQVGE